MINWKRQGAAVVGELTYTDGQSGNVILVGPRSNPRGAALLVAGEQPDKPVTKLLPASLDLLTSECTVEILCMQERAFGSCGLPEPEDLA